MYELRRPNKVYSTLVLCTYPPIDACRRWCCCLRYLALPMANLPSNEYSVRIQLRPVAICLGRSSSEGRVCPQMDLKSRHDHTGYCSNCENENKNLQERQQQGFKTHSFQSSSMKSSLPPHRRAKEGRFRSRLTCASASSWTDFKNAALRG